jgi:hypothetical protein
MLQVGRSRVRFPMRSRIFQFTYTFQPHYGPGFDIASNRNEHQESSSQVKDGRGVNLTSPPSVSRLCRENVGASMSHNPMGLHGLLKGQLYLFNFNFLYSYATTNFPWLSPTESWLVPEPNEFCHLYSRGADTHHRKRMSRDHHPPLRDVTVDTENIASSIVACWTVFTELLPCNALIKSVTILSSPDYHK